MKRIVGTVASMRVASVMRPSFKGTFRSARTKTRFPRTSRSRSERTRLRRSADRAADQRRDVAHPAREAPLVVVPGEDLDEVLVEDARQLAVEDRRVGRAVEVRGHELLGAVVQDALQRA